MTKKNQKLKILHIAGTQRSGSTIIEKILGEIDEIVSLGETRFVWERGFGKNQLCSCGKHFHDCEFWQKVKQQAFPNLNDNDIKTAIKLGSEVARIRYLPLFFLKPLFPIFYTNLKNYAQLLFKIYESAASVSNTLVTTDSSQNMYGHVLFDIPGIELYVVHLVRDVRATAYSWTKKKVYEKDKDGNITYLPRSNPLKSSIGWIIENISTELLGLRCKYYMRIRYEDFVREPRNILKQIFTFIKEPDLPLPVSEDFKVNLKLQHLVSGNPVRFNQGETIIKSDNQWKRVLPISTQIGLACLTWPLLLRYGYSLFPQIEKP